MKLITAFFLLFFTIHLCQASNSADSILQEIEQADVHDKMAAWEKWFKNPTKSNILDLYKNEERALSDATLSVGRDSALIWHYKKRGTLVYRLSRLGFKDYSIQVMDKMKVILKKYSMKHGENHIFSIYWYITLGKLHWSQNELDKSEVFLLKAIETIGESDYVNKPGLKFHVFGNLFLMKSYTGDIEEASKYSELAELNKNASSISIKRKIHFLNNQAYFYQRAKEHDIADSLYQIILDSLHLFSDIVVRNIQLNYSSNLYQMGRINKGINYLLRLKPIIESEESITNKHDLYADLKNAFFLAGRYKESLEWTEKYFKAKLEIEKNRRSDAVQEWQAKYDSTEKEAKIKTLEQEKTIGQFRLTIISLIGFFAIGILSFFLYQNRNRQKQLANELERDRQIAENRDRLFTSISHDIRTPLSLMLAPLKRAEKNVKKGMVKDDIQLAQRNGKRLMELFNQILDWNKAEAKALVLNPQIGQLDVAFKSMTQRFEQQAIEKGLNFTSSINLPQGHFSLDFDKTDKVLSNLIGNALKFCESGQNIHLTAEVETKSDNQTLLLMVRDDGTGISKEEQQEVFTKYNQGKEGILKGGTGIGLALVKELVKILNGEIQLISAINKGTTFHVKIPLNKVNDPGEFITFENEEIIAKGNGQFNEKLILVIEDEPELLTFLKSALSQNYKVVVANSASTGVNIATSQIPDLIISDWMLPDHDGSWVCRNISRNELTTHIPVMILSAHHSSSKQQEAFDAGAIAWMSKPFQLEGLQKQLNTILMQQEKVQERWSRKEIIGDQVVPKIDPFLEKVEKLIYENYADENFSVERLANLMFLSRIQLFRKIKSLTGHGPNKLIIEYRLNQAKEFLQKTDMSISDVAYAVGFNNPNYFSKVYKQFFDVSPSQDLMPK